MMKSGNYLQPYSDIQSAYGDALHRLGPESKVFVIPWGGSTLPWTRLISKVFPLS